MPTCLKTIAGKSQAVILFDKSWILVRKSHKFRVLRNRNPDGEDDAWCYTVDPNVRWESCGIPDCEGFTPTNTNCGTASRLQADYRGTHNVTVSGLTCQRWDEQSPHEHTVTPVELPNAGLEENYCR